MKFLVDNQLPIALSRLLAERGVECHHVLDLGLAQASDAKILEYASQHEMIVISKDEDFFHLSGQMQPAVQLVWIRLGNCRRSFLLSAFAKIWPRIEESLRAGERVVEVR